MNHDKFVGKVSVIVPCFNSGHELIRALDSVILQTYKDIQIIVVDDGSTMLSTKSLLSKIEQNGIKVLRHKNNLGLSAARNSGIAAAESEFLLFLDSDDWLDNSCIEKMVSKVPPNTNSFFVYCDIKFELQRSGTAPRIYRPFSQLIMNGFPYCILVSKSALNGLNLYRTELKDGLEDWDFNLMLLENNFLPIRVEEPLFHYSWNQNGMFFSKTIFSFFSIYRNIRLFHKNLYAFGNLFSLINREIHMFGFTSVFPSIILFLTSLFPIDNLLNKLFVFYYFKLKSKKNNLFFISFFKD